MGIDKKTFIKELMEIYRILVAQSSKTVAIAWFQETIERRKAINFIKNKGLYEEYLKTTLFE